jgi:hypothetical protein
LKIWFDLCRGGVGTWTRKLERNLNILRALQLRVGLFNIVFAKILFLAKCALLVCAILGGFAGMRIANRNPPLAYIYFICWIDPTISYAAMFQLAFRVTKEGVALKRELFGFARRLVLQPPRALPRHMIMRILSKSPPLAVSIGGFHKVEQETIPRFLDFMVKQIVGLLVTF